MCWTVKNNRGNKKIISTRNRRKTSVSCSKVLKMMGCGVGSRMKHRLKTMLTLALRRKFFFNVTYFNVISGKKKSIYLIDKEL